MSKINEATSLTSSNRDEIIDYLATGSNRSKVSGKTYSDGYAKCGICGETVRIRNAVLDHKFPSARGGSDLVRNLQIAHDKCNEEKGDQYPYP